MQCQRSAVDELMKKLQNVLSKSSTKKVCDAYPTKYIIESTTSSPKQEHKAMQATLNIDDKLFQEAVKLAATENQSQLIEIALSEFIKNHQQA